MAGRARSGAIAGAVFSRRIHAAERAAPHRLPEQPRGLQPADEGGGRDDARHRKRPQATWGEDRCHRRAAQLGLGAHPSSARAHDRAGWRALARRHAMGRLALQLPRAVNLLGRLFRGKMLAMLTEAYDASQLTFFNTLAGLADKRTFKRFIAPLRRIKWVVYCKAPFAVPKQALFYLTRDTHRVAISNRRLIAADDRAIAFRWKDYRVNGPDRWKTMRLHPHEFMRRFLMHVLPKGFHRIRH